jgi:hypothetical protein
MSLHRARARQKLRIAQISAAGLLGLAGLLVAMPAPEVIVPAPPIPRPGSEGGPPVATPGGVTVSENALGVFHNRVAKSAPIAKAADAPPPENPVPGDGSGEEPPEPIVEDGPPHFRFVGMVSSPRRTYAFIADPDGATRTVAQGEYYDDHGEWLILGISSERMVLADCDDNRHDYFIADRIDAPSPEAAVNLSAPQSNTVAPKATAGEPPRGYVPPGITDPAERERLEAKMREVEDRRNQALKGNTPGQPATPPTRPATLPQPRPGQPASKTGGNNKDVK